MARGSEIVGFTGPTGMISSTRAIPSYQPIHRDTTTHKRIAITPCLPHPTTTAGSQPRLSGLGVSAEHHPLCPLREQAPRMAMGQAIEPAGSLAPAVSQPGWS